MNDDIYNQRPKNWCCYDRDCTWDIMVDIECAGKCPDGAIISIGWADFSLDSFLPTIGSMKTIHVDPVSAQAAGQKFDAEVLAWWMQQDKGVRAQWYRPMGYDEHRCSLADALKTLAQHVDAVRQFTSPQRRPLLWAYPATYDLAVLDYAFDKTGVRRTWDRRAYMCARTLMKAKGFRRERLKLPDWCRAKHLPEIDAARQALQLKACVKPEIFGAWLRPTPEGIVGEGSIDG